MQTHSNLRRSS